MILLDKSPKLKWKDIKKYKAEYGYDIVQVQSDANDLYVKFSGKHMQPNSLYYVVKEYSNTTPVEIFSIENGFTNGRHFNDAILDFYHSNNLHLGYVKPITKQLK